MEKRKDRETMHRALAYFALHAVRYEGWRTFSQLGKSTPARKAYFMRCQCCYMRAAWFPPLSFFPVRTAGWYPCICVLLAGTVSPGTQAQGNRPLWPNSALNQKSKGTLLSKKFDLVYQGTFSAKNLDVFGEQNAFLGSGKQESFFWKIWNECFCKKIVKKLILLDKYVTKRTNKRALVGKIKFFTS